MSLGRDIFAEGQAYVALSRVSTLSQLFLLELDPRAFRANPRALAFDTDEKNKKSTKRLKLV